MFILSGGLHVYIHMYGKARNYVCIFESTICSQFFFHFKLFYYMLNIHGIGTNLIYKDRHY